ncbi:MAG: DUF192 domain-containing protein [Firmicutes bacterium]|nr:DUF192 domain-containing protein [Bacillota bacterium]
MELYNVTRQVTLASQVELANTFWRRCRGLLGRPEMPHGSGLLLTPCRAIHTCFMRFAIDVLFVDREFQVLFVIEEMQPFVISPKIPEAKMVIELPAGTVRSSNTRVGDLLKLTALIK